VKKRELLKRLNKTAAANDLGFDLVRQGANHEVWQIGSQRLIIPRHSEINEMTAAGILKTAAKEVAGNDET